MKPASLIRIFSELPLVRYFDLMVVKSLPLYINGPPAQNPTTRPLLLIWRDDVAIPVTAGYIPTVIDRQGKYRN